MLMAQFAIIMHYPSHLQERPSHEKQDGHHHECALCVAGNVINNVLVPVAALLTLAAFAFRFGWDSYTSTFRYSFLKFKYATGPPVFPDIRG